MSSDVYTNPDNARGRRITQAAYAVHGAWHDGTDDGPSLRALVKAWARHFNVTPTEVWGALDPLLD